MRLALLTLLLAATPALAEHERFALAQRLRRFEAAWERADDAGRDRARVVVRPVSRLFLSLQMGEAMRTLDAAWLALLSERPTDAEKSLASLTAYPEAVLLPASRDRLAVRVRHAYPVDGPPPAGAALRLQLFGAARDLPLNRLPLTAEVPREPAGGSVLLRAELRLGGRSLDERAVRVHFRDAWGAFGRLPRPGAADFPERAGVEVATLRAREDRLTVLRGGELPETDLPLRQWEFDAVLATLAGSFGGRYFADAPLDRTPEAVAPGQLWLTIPTPGRATDVRLFVPEGLTKPAPVVVALHGAGGTENLFFDGYGDGCVHKACRERGWFLLTPNGGLGLFGAPPVPELVAELARRYPVDPSRVFVVGHSLGAGQTVGLVRANPNAFAGWAALGGGGRGDVAALAAVPGFVGAGREDFAYRAGAELRDAVRAKGGDKLTYREYPGADHLLIVREACADVFAAWDKVAGR